MAKTSRAAQIFALALIFILSAGSTAVGIASLEIKGVAFTSCRVSGCHTNLALAVGSGIIAAVSLIGLIGVCLGRDDDYNPYND